MEITKSNISTLQERLKKWGEKLYELTAEAEEAGAEAPNAHHELIAELRLKHEVAEAKLRALREAGGQRWEALKEDAERAWRDLELVIGRLAN